MQIKGLLFIGYFLSNFGYGRCVGEDLSSHFEDQGFKVFRTSSVKNRYIRVFDMVYTIIRNRGEYQAAYVEVYNGLAFIWAEIACLCLRLLRKPYIITLHGARMLQFAQRWPKRIRRMLQQASVVTTPSKLFTENFSAWRKDIVYLPNAINIETYKYKLRNKPNPKLGWLRKFEHNYNPNLAVRTIGLLAKDYPNVKLTMSGADFHDGSSDDVKNLMKILKLSSQIEITGFISRLQIPEWFCQSDIYLNTTNVESFGIAVIEAAACGLCIVTTNVGELPYLWEDGVDALLVSPNDPDAMAAAVKRILTEPGLAEKLSANARKKAEQFDWSKILPQWEKLFSELIEKEKA